MKSDNLNEREREREREDKDNMEEKNNVYSIEIYKEKANKDSRDVFPYFLYVFLGL
jgi:hypothetical protein